MRRNREFSWPWPTSDHPDSCNSSHDSRPSPPECSGTCYGSAERIMQLHASRCRYKRPPRGCSPPPTGRTNGRCDRSSPRSIPEFSPLTDPSLTSFFVLAPSLSRPSTPTVTCARPRARRSAHHVYLILPGPAPQPGPRIKGPTRPHYTPPAAPGPARRRRRRLCPWDERRVEEYLARGGRPGVVLARGVVTW